MYTLRCWSASISFLVGDATSYLNLVHQLVVSGVLDGMTLSHALFHHDSCSHASDDNNFQNLRRDRNLMCFLFTLHSQNCHESITIGPLLSFIACGTMCCVHRLSGS